MFEKANRLRLRFDSCKGKLSTEDLWDMPLTSRDGFDLDTVAKSVNKHIKNLEEESFVNIKPSSMSSVYNLKLDVLKHIIGVRVNDLKSKEESALKKERKEKILSIIAEKQDSSLKEKTLEELTAELKELD